jgi:TolA-binding protein
VAVAALASAVVGAGATGTPQGPPGVPTITLRGRVDTASGGALDAALHSPQLSTAVPIEIATHQFGRASSGPLRVLVTVSVGRNLVEPIDVQVGYVITTSTGSVVTNGVEEARLFVSRASAAGSAPFVAVVALPAGDYKLRAAAVDAAGRVGSADHRFSAAPGDGDGLAVSDLLLLDPTRAPSEGIAPLTDGRVRGSGVGVYVEAYLPAGGSPPPSISFGIGDTADGPPMVQGKPSALQQEADGRTSAEARLDISLLPPGNYMAVATISDGTRVVARRSRPLTIEPAAPTASGAAAGSSAPPRVRFTVGPSSSLVKPFARTDVLTPDTVAFFVKRLAAAERKPAPPGVDTASAALRSGQYDVALSALRDGAPDRLSVAFLAGLAWLGKGDLEPAAKQFRDALRIADDFLPAAFYLGSCYAAGGRDSEAVGAWQTALVTESDARIVYDVLADALLRLGDAERAVAVLSEARDRWPNDGGFLPRLAAAQAMLERRGEALTTLEAYLKGHQKDAEAAALAIRLIYDAHAAGRVVKSPAADRELAATYRDLIRAAGGANQALVDRWVAFILKS